jgi:hypothetical protein
MNLKNTAKLTAIFAAALFAVVLAATIVHCDSHNRVERRPISQEHRLAASQMSLDAMLKARSTFIKMPSIIGSGCLPARTMPLQIRALRFGDITTIKFISIVHCFGIFML